MANFNSSAEIREKKNIYFYAVRNREYGHPILIFWTGEIELSNTRRLIFNESIERVVRGKIDAAWTEDAEGNIKNFVVNPEKVTRKTLNFIMSKWSPDVNELEVENR